MNAGRRVLMAAVSATALSMVPFAQDPCIDLQAALDAAAPGATIYAWDHLVASHCHGVTITKPVTLIGGEYGGEHDGSSWSGGGPARGITLDGPGHGTVTLIGCSTWGMAGRNAGIWSGIGGGGFDTLHVVGGSIRAIAYCGYGYDATGDCAIDYACQGSSGTSAISVTIPTVILENTFVEAAAIASGGDFWAVPSPGVHAPGSLLVTINTTIHGGNAGSYFQDGPNTPCRSNERRSWEIPGGAAVYCRDLIDVGSKFHGGRGARWIRTDHDCSSGATYAHPCYSSPDGPPVVFSGPRRDPSSKVR